MAIVRFTANLQRHVACPELEIDARTVREALEATFRSNQRLASYVLDDQGAVRKHMNIFVDGEMIRDRETQGDELRPNSEIYVMQALSGG